MDIITMLAWLFAIATLACYALWAVLLFALLWEIGTSVYQLLRVKS